MKEDLGERLAEAVGPKGVAGDVVSPPDAAALVRVAQLCHDRDVAITVTSGPAKADATSPAGGIVVSLHKLSGIDVSAPGLTVRAAAGATVAHLREAAARHKLAVVGLGAQTGSAHVGTLVARGDVPRRSLAGVEAVLSTGEAVRAGGGVLKDVVGYDLLAVLLGSQGRLALITAVTFRLEPAAARTPTAKPPGPRTWEPALAGAFDPKGLLRAGASR